MMQHYLLAFFLLKDVCHISCKCIPWMVGIENLLDNASRTTALPKLYFDALKMVHYDLGILVLWQHVHRQ